MQKFLTILLIALMAVLVACGGDDSEETTDSGAASNDDTPAQVDDTAEDADADDDVPAEDDVDAEPEAEASGDVEAAEVAFTEGEALYSSNNIYDEEIEISLMGEDGRGPGIDIVIDVVDGEIIGTFDLADTEKIELTGSMTGIGFNQFEGATGSVTIDAIGETVSGSFEANGSEAILSGTFTDILMINPQGFALQNEYNQTVRSNNEGFAIVELTADDVEWGEVPYSVNFRAQDPAENGQEGPVVNILNVTVDGTRYAEANDGQQPPNSLSFIVSYLPSLQPGEYPLTTCGNDTPEDTVCALIGFVFGTTFYNSDPDDLGTITVESVEPFTATINANVTSLDPADIENSPTGQATITLDGLVPVSFPDLPAEGF